ncbi:hypothetical protein NRK67_17240 (plasmid) [Fusobacteria bacterium ZRK30]|nr:hypothetical protein NRK67_17240 [Fusobacteria bacterium ZRK30]
MYYIIVAELGNGRDRSRTENYLMIDKQEKLNNTNIDIQDSRFLKTKSEYYALILNDTKLIYLGYSNNLEIPMVSLKKYLEKNENPLIPFRLNPIEKSFSELDIKGVPNDDNLGEIFGKLKAIDITDHIFKHEKDFCILIQ